MTIIGVCDMDYREMEHFRSTVLFNFLNENNDGCVTNMGMKKAIRKIKNHCVDENRPKYGYYYGQETTWSATESQKKDNVIISVFICGNSCNRQSIAIQPLAFSQILSKK